MIAVVAIDRIDTGKNGDETAHAKMEQTLKGKASEKITIVNDIQYACARVSLSSGRFLVFLWRDGDQLKLRSWVPPMRIDQDKMKWDGNAPESLSDVLEKIRGIITQQAAEDARNKPPKSNN